MVTLKKIILWNFRLLALLPAMAVLSSGPVMAAGCPENPASPTVTVTTSPGQIILKRGSSRDDLIRLQATNNASVPNKNGYPLGLTLTDFRYSIETGVNIRQLSAGRYCAYPASFDLDIRFSDFLVYIDRRYKRGSCEYKAVNRHEYTHVVLYRKQLERHLPNLRHQAQTAARRIKPIIVRTPNDGVKLIQKAMQDKMTPLIDSLSRDADTANARIDTPESYRKIQKQCRNW